MNVDRVFGLGLPPATDLRSAGSRVLEQLNRRGLSLARLGEAEALWKTVGRFAVRVPPSWRTATVAAVLLAGAATTAAAHHGTHFPPILRDFHADEGLTPPHPDVDDNSARALGEQYGFAPNVIFAASAMEFLYELDRAGVRRVDKSLDGKGPFIVPGWVAERGARNQGEKADVELLMRFMGADVWTSKEGVDETEHIILQYRAAVAYQGLLLSNGLVPYRIHPAERLPRVPDERPSRPPVTTPRGDQQPI